MSIPQFTAAAALYRRSSHDRLSTSGKTTDSDGQVVPALVGRWPIPWTDCSVECAEVCVRFCGPTGWNCCGWETRCVLNCSGETIGGIAW